jgi:hypothetical protein
MTRAPWLLAALVLVAGAAQAPDTHSIKLRDKTVGDVLEVDDQSTEQGQVKVLDSQGKAVMDKGDYKTGSFAYRETILDKPGEEKRPTRLRRQYTRAEVRVGTRVEVLPYQGKTLLIEKQDGKFRFRIEGGEEIAAKDAPHLDEEFNKKQASGLDVRKVFLPDRPVRVGESWKIDPAPLIKELTRGEDSAVTVDAAKATAVGKLLEVYRKDSQLHGKLEIQVDLPLREFSRGNEKLALQAGSRMLVTVSADVCIDGSTNSGVMKSTMNMTANAVLPLPDGTQGKLLIASKVTGQEQRKDLSKK